MPTADDRARANGTAETRDTRRPANASGLPSNITLVYESDDKRFCLFQDANGHLTSVRAAKLA